MVVASEEAEKEIAPVMGTTKQVPNAVVVAAAAAVLEDQRAGLEPAPPTGATN